MLPYLLVGAAIVAVRLSDRRAEWAAVLLVALAFIAYALGIDVAR